MKQTIVEVIRIEAGDGKTFARKETGEALGVTLYLGINDSADNYVEIDIPEKPEGEQTLVDAAAQI